MAASVTSASTSVSPLIWIQRSTVALLSPSATVKSRLFALCRTVGASASSVMAMVASVGAPSFTPLGWPRMRTLKVSSPS